MSDPSIEIKYTNGAIVKIEQQALLEAFQGYLEELDCRIEENAFYIEPEVFSIAFKKQTIKRREAVATALRTLRSSMVEHIRPVTDGENNGST